MLTSFIFSPTFTHFLCCFLSRFPHQPSLSTIQCLPPPGQLPLSYTLSSTETLPHPLSFPKTFPLPNLRNNQSLPTFSPLHNHNNVVFTATPILKFPITKASTQRWQASLTLCCREKSRAAIESGTKTLCTVVKSLWSPQLSLFCSRKCVFVRCHFREPRNTVLQDREHRSVTKSVYFSAEHTILRAPFPKM